MNRTSWSACLQAWDRCLWSGSSAHMVNKGKRGEKKNAQKSAVVSRCAPSTVSKRRTWRWFVYFVQTTHGVDVSTLNQAGRAFSPPSLSPARLRACFALMASVWIRRALQLDDQFVAKACSLISSSAPPLPDDQGHRSSGGARADCSCWKGALRC